MTTTITRTCPAWCADHFEFDVLSGWHKTAPIRWSQREGCTVRIEEWFGEDGGKPIGEPAEIIIEGFSEFASPTLEKITAAEARALSAALAELSTTLADYGSGR